MELKLSTTTAMLMQSKPEKNPIIGTPIIYSTTDWERQYDAPARRKEERSAAEIDRSRIIHCAAFRRLQGKTQIFGVAHDDFFRTRLTHSLEVAQIAKGVALIVGADPDLVEAICLAHDIGHPPFGHTGERTLNECMVEQGFGQFESNAQNLRTLNYLEVKHIDFPGLNLTRATLDGLLKHKKYPGRMAVPLCYPTEQPLLGWVVEGSPPDQTSLETQIMDWADEVAYSVHDLEDGIHAQMITSARLADASLKEMIIESIMPQFPRNVIDDTYEYLMNALRLMEELGDARHRAAARKQLTSQLIHRFVTSVKFRSIKAGSEKGRYTVRITVARNEQGWAAVLKEIARRLIIHDQRVATLERRSRFVVRKLFEELMRPDAIDLYPEDFRGYFESALNDAARGRVACDYIAGMTDSYAEMMFQRLFSPGTGSVFDTL